MGGTRGGVNNEETGGGGDRGYCLVSGCLLDKRGELEV